VGIIVDNGEQHLYVERAGTFRHPRRRVIVQYDERDTFEFDLTELERKALIQALTITTHMPEPECYESPVADHVPGCEHVT